MTTIKYKLQLDKQLINPLRTQLCNQIDWELYYPLRTQLKDQLLNQLKNNLS